MKKNSGRNSPSRQTRKKKVIKKSGTGTKPAVHIDPAFLAEFTRQFQEAGEKVIAIANDILGERARNFAAYEPELQAKILSLFQAGWAVDPDQPILFVRLAIGEFGDFSEADQWISNHYESRMDEMQLALTTRHPDRAPVLADALDAHREGRYTLSVPVLLSQADGIIGSRYERTQLFSRSRHHGLASQVKEMDHGQLSTMWAEIMSGKAEVSSNTQDLPEGFEGLNRHAVMHGTDVNYGTKANSLKAISMLYMASFFASLKPI